jgi:hypothetical protein
MKWLGASADLTTLGQALLKVQESGLINKVIERFAG